MSNFELFVKTVRELGFEPDGSVEEQRLDTSLKFVCGCLPESKQNAVTLISIINGNSIHLSLCHGSTFIVCPIDKTMNWDEMAQSTIISMAHYYVETYKELMKRANILMANF